MRAIVSDYSKRGDLICDPCAGGATTLLAAAMEGRRAVGSEMDPNTFALAQKRIAKGYTPPLPGIDAALASAKQEGLGL
jgi:site-specific DNA-methyltransferase (adenine-specific)